MSTARLTHFEDQEEHLSPDISPCIEHIQTMSKRKLTIEKDPNRI